VSVWGRNGRKNISRLERGCTREVSTRGDRGDGSGPKEIVLLSSVLGWIGSLARGGMYTVVTLTRMA